MADLDSMPQAPVRIDVAPRLLDAAIVFARERRGGFEIAWQQRKERFERLGYELEVRRELPEERTELVPQRQHAGGEEVGDRGARCLVAEPQHVREIARTFDAEREAVGR